MGLVFVTMPAAIGQVRSGKLRALAVTTLKRNPGAPEVPTVAEALNIPDFEVDSWYAIFAPAKTPPAIIERIQSVIAAGLKEQRETFTRQGQDPGGDTPAQFADFLRSEQERFVKIAKNANMPRQNYGAVR